MSYLGEALDASPMIAREAHTLACRHADAADWARHRIPWDCIVVERIQ